jgi:hypothetical protein
MFMKLLSKAVVTSRVRAGFALLTLFAAVAPGIFATDKLAKPQEVPATVVGHLPLPAAPGNQMFLQKKGNKQYLYIQQASKQGYMIVDVTKANDPIVLERTAPANQPTKGNLEMVGPDVALAESPEKNPGTVSSVARPAESIKVLDMSDPAKPKTLQTFDGVTSILPDNGRIYLTNDEGLWVLRFSQYQKRQLPPCDSNSVFSPIVDCQ